MLNGFTLGVLGFSLVQYFHGFAQTVKVNKFIFNIAFRWLM